MNYANLDSPFNPDFLLLDEDGGYSSDRYPYQKEMYAIIGACMEVHSVLGRGFVESVYHEALCIELEKRNIPFEKNKILFVYYKDVRLKKTFEADIVAYGHIIVELKAIEGSLDAHQGQVINYLFATKHEIGLLVNFGMPSLQYRRFIVSKNRKHN